MMKFIKQLANKVRVFHERMETRRALERLSDRELDDIGLTRVQIENV